ncbi:hypothetical protein OK016_20570 [Vibrio chagasii]|nr:hypothetical protein [Vibrio chagasii]
MIPTPYTGGHCQRVPELTKWLTQATIDDDRYYLPQFSWTTNSGKS